MSPSERREMIRKENTNLSLTRQCKLVEDQSFINLLHAGRI